MKSLDKYLTWAMNTLIVAAMAIMVVLVFSNVVLRYAFNSGITFSEEFARLCFLWLVFIGSIVAMKEGAHLGVDSLVSRMPKTGKVICTLTSNVLMLWVCYLFFSGSWTQTVVGWGTLKPATGIPMAFHYATGLVMSVGVAIIILNNTWRILSGKATNADLVKVAESEEISADQNEPKTLDAQSEKKN